MFDKDNNKEGGREVEKKDYNMGCAFMFLDETKAIDLDDDTGLPMLWAVIFGTVSAIVR